MTLIHALPNLIAPLPGGHVALLTAWILVLLDRTCFAFSSSHRLTSRKVLHFSVTRVQPQKAAPLRKPANPRND